MLNVVSLTQKKRNYKKGRGDLSRVEDPDPQTLTRSLSLSGERIPLSLSHRRPTTWRCRRLARVAGERKGRPPTLSSSPVLPLLFHAQAQLAIHLPPSRVAGEPRGRTTVVPGRSQHCHQLHPLSPSISPRTAATPTASWAAEVCRNPARRPADLERAR